MINVKETIGKNLTQLRKDKKLTQLELAEKFNYSDKSVSKWEHGEVMPDIEVLVNLATFYEVSLDYLISDNPQIKITRENKKQNNNKIIISLLAVSLVWILATLLYAYIEIFTGFSYWRAFIWAVPASTIILIVFNAVWGKRKFSLTLTSILTWSFLTGVFLELIKYNTWTVFLLGAPIQIAIILWSQLKPKKK